MTDEARRVNNEPMDKNANGVEGYTSHSGQHFGTRQPDGSFRTCIPCFVPRVCIGCRHFDSGEYGDYGSLLAGPECELGIYPPTRSGVCAKREPIWLCELDPGSYD